MSETFDLAGTLANYDLNESALRRYLAERMARLAEDRKKGIQSNQQNSSSRNMLQSTAALTDVADTNLEFDREIGNTNDAVNQDLMKIAQGRTDAQNQYQIYLQNQAKAAAAAKPAFDPTDPYNWKGIAAQQAAANSTLPPSPGVNPTAAPAITPVAGGTPDDPFNWKGIAAEQAAARAAAKPIATPRPRATPVTTPKKPIASKPKQGYY
jgi:hypothetical protein